MLDKLAKARTRLILQQPFFGSIAMKLPLIESDCETMATDGKAIYYNPAFVDELSPAELAGVLAHEVMHLALKHHTRRGGRDHSDWNAAGDYAINPLLVDANFSLPKGAYIDDRFRDMPTDAIYNVIHAEKDQDEAEGTADPGQCGGVMDFPAIDEAELATADQDMTIDIMQAAATAKAAGKMTEGIESIIEEIRHPSQNWQEALRAWADQISKNDYAWSPPNKRYISSGLYLPSLYSNEVGEIIIAIDSSGSISQDTLNTFGAELKSIFAEVIPERVHLIICDTAIKKVITYEKGEFDLPVIHGRGGTSLIPPFNWVDDNGISPAGLIYFTDLGGPMPDDPGYPVLWLTEPGNKEQAPFGQTIQL